MYVALPMRMGVWLMAVMLQQQIDYYNYSILDEAHGERSKDSIRGKCTQYLERAEQLKKYVNKKSKKVHSSGGTAHKETKK